MSETRIKGQDLKSKIHDYIVAAKFTAVVLIAWMAAGQACMCLRGLEELSPKPIHGLAADNVILLLASYFSLMARDTG